MEIEISDSEEEETKSESEEDFKTASSSSSKSKRKGKAKEVSSLHLAAPPDTADSGDEPVEPESGPGSDAWSEDFRKRYL